MQAALNFSTPVSVPRKNSVLLRPRVTAAGDSITVDTIALQPRELSCSFPCFCCFCYDLYLKTCGNPEYFLLASILSCSSCKHYVQDLSFSGVFCSVFPSEACEVVGGEACDAAMYPEVKPRERRPAAEDAKMLLRKLTENTWSIMSPRRCFQMRPAMISAGNSVKQSTRKESVHR